MGWLLSVRFGNVEKKALAIKEETKLYSNSVLSAEMIHSQKNPHVEMYSYAAAAG